MGDLRRGSEGQASERKTYGQKLLQLGTLKSERDAISSSSSRVAEEADMRDCCWLEVTRWGLLTSPWFTVMAGLTKQKKKPTLQFNVVVVKNPRLTASALQILFIPRTGTAWKAAGPDFPHTVPKYVSKCLPGDQFLWHFQPFALTGAN